MQIEKKNLYITLDIQMIL